MCRDDKVDPDGFWAGKIPCWRIRGCIPQARRRCLGYTNQQFPCWEQETLCKELLGLKTCDYCEVYRLYGWSADGSRGEGN